MTLSSLRIFGALSLTGNKRLMLKIYTFIMSEESTVELVVGLDIEHSNLCSEETFVRITAQDLASL